MRNRVIFFEFAGRRANMELQLPLFERILQDHPNVELHLWNLARSDADGEYIKGITGDRITVINDFYGNDPWRFFDEVYRHYASKFYRYCLFVKIDDDVVFIETKRFGHFLKAIEMNPRTVLSAKTINNGASTVLDPVLFQQFRQLRMRLLDVHRSFPYAQLCHRYFLDNWGRLMEEPFKIIPTDEWLSINLIGYGWDTAAKMAELLGTQPPHFIAGRVFRGHDILGDEGLVNMLPRAVCQGFTAAHLYFGPQVRRGGGERGFNEFRERYAEVGRRYLEC